MTKHTRKQSAYSPQTTRATQNNIERTSPALALHHSRPCKLRGGHAGHQSSAFALRSRHDCTIDVRTASATGIYTCQCINHQTVAQPPTSRRWWPGGSAFGTRRGVKGDGEAIVAVVAAVRAGRPACRWCFRAQTHESGAQCAQGTRQNFPRFR